MIEKIKRYLGGPLLFETVVDVPPFHPVTQNISSGPPLLAQAFQSANLGDFLTALFNIAISVGAILAVLRLAYAGFKYITAEAAGAKNDAKQIIQSAVMGLLLLLAIVLILQRINPDLLKIDFSLNGSSSSTQTTGGGSPFPGQ